MSTTFRIKHLSGSLAGRDQRIALSEGQTIRLGRGAENDVRFNAAVDDTVSGVHAELSWRGGRLTIEDQRSSNGTFVNGAPCPPFEKLAVPDGSRVRLGREGPEMQVTFEAAAAGATAGAAAGGQAEPPRKEAVGRETLLREIDRAKQEERDHMVDEVDRSRKKTGLWLAAASVVLVALVAGGVWLVNRSSAANVEEAERDLQARIDSVGDNAWSQVESKARPAVGHVRVRYHLASPNFVDGEFMGTTEEEPAIVTGTAVLIGPGLALTAKHVVAPWEMFDFSDMEFGEDKKKFRDWKHFADQNGFKAVHDRLEIQFPGRQPIAAEVIATGEVSDLALLSVPAMAIDPVDVELSNDAVDVTDDVGILGYPYALGALETLAKDTTRAESSFKEVRDMEATFIRGTVSRPVAEVGETSRYFFLDASIEPGNSGGPVLSREGKVIGIISSRRMARTTVEIWGQHVPFRRPVTAAGRAVGPSDIAAFLERAGVR